MYSLMHLHFVIDTSIQFNCMKRQRSEVFHEVAVAIVLMAVLLTLLTTCYFALHCRLCNNVAKVAVAIIAKLLLPH